MYFATKQEMVNEYNQMLMTKMKLDKFFSLFLDKCGDKMNPDKTNTPEWKLYKQKMKEYGALNTAIKTMQYRISKV